MIDSLTYVFFLETILETVSEEDEKLPVLTAIESATGSNELKRACQEHRYHILNADDYQATTVIDDYHREMPQATPSNNMEFLKKYL